MVSYMFSCEEGRDMMHVSLCCFSLLGLAFTFCSPNTLCVWGGSVPAWLAQSVEQETLNLRVVGLSPTSGASLFFVSHNVLCTWCHTCLAVRKEGT